MLYGKQHMAIKICLPSATQDFFLCHHITLPPPWTHVEG
jgi:hypothetical protein